MTAAPILSVIVPVYDARRLACTLSGLKRQKISPRLFEVIVVDNGSPGNLAELKAEYSEFIWCREPTPGAYRARNRGIRAARGTLLAFTDADCVPESDWAERGVQAFNATKGAGLVTGRIVFEFADPQRPSACELYDSLCSLQQQKTLSQSRFGATANLFTSRAVLDTIGVFDERLMSGGDREWGNRVFAAGLKQVYSADVVVRHGARRTIGELIDKSLRVTVATRVAGPDARYSLSYVRRHVFTRPWDLNRRMVADHGAALITRAQVGGLYFAIKALQLVERVRVRLGGRPRR